MFQSFKRRGVLMRRAKSSQNSSGNYCLNQPREVCSPPAGEVEMRELKKCPL
jgi:hypothetical protein